MLSTKNVIIVILIVFIIGCLSGGYVVKKYMPTINTVTSDPITVTKEVLSDPITLTKVIKEPYAVTSEIIREIDVTKPSQTAIVDPDKILVTKDIQTTTDTKTNVVTQHQINKYYNITLDRKYEIGMVSTNHGFAYTVGVNPNKNTAINVMYGKDIKGAGLSLRF